MKNIYYFILSVCFMWLAPSTHAQFLGFECEIVRYRSSITGDDAGQGNADIRWLIRATMNDADGPYFPGTGQYDYEQVFFAEDEYTGGWIDSSHVLLNMSPRIWNWPNGTQELCGAYPQMNIRLSGWEDDNGNNSYSSGIDDHFTQRIDFIGADFGDVAPDWTNQTLHVKAAGEFYEVEIRYRYTLQVLQLQTTLERTIGGVTVLEACEGESYLVGAGFGIPDLTSTIQWQRAVTGTSNWEHYQQGEDLYRIRVNASRPTYKYRMRILPIRFNCLGDSLWRETSTVPGAWRVNPRAPRAGEVLRSATIDCPNDGNSDGTFTVDFASSYDNPDTALYTIGLYYGPDVNSGQYDSQSDIPGSAIPYTFTNVPEGYYYPLVTRQGLGGTDCTDRTFGGPFAVNSGFEATITTVYRTNPKCNGASTGRIKGVASYRTNVFRLEGPGGYDQTITVPQAFSGKTFDFTGLAAGNYMMTATSWPSGCQTTYNYILTEPDAITYQVNLTPPDCPGELGVIEVFNLNGGNPYTDNKYEVGIYNGSTLVSSATFAGGRLFNLPAANYEVRVKDANGCEVAMPANVVDPVPVSSSLIPTHPSNCTQLGSITAAGTGGAGNYQYSLDSLSFTTNPTFVGLPPGFYTVFTKDANNCVGADTITLIIPTPIVNVTHDSINPAACSNSGVVYITPSGGVAPYTYSIDSITYVADSTFMSLPPGSFRVFAKDINGCIGKKTVVLQAPVFPTLTLNASSLICTSTSEGVISGSGSGGFPPYAIEVFDNMNMRLDSVNVSGSFSIGDKSAGTYKVSLTDASGCNTENFITIEQREPIQILDILTDAVTCYDDPPTTIKIRLRGWAVNGVVEGASPGITASTDSSSFSTATEVFDNGIYADYTYTPSVYSGDIYIVQSSFGCAASNTKSFDTDRPDSLRIEVISTDSVLCYGEYSGKVTVKVTGGIKPYEVLLRRAAGGPTIDAFDASLDSIFVFDGLTAFFPYRIEVRDHQTSSGGFCTTAITPISVDQPTQLQVTANQIGADLNCAEDNGMLSITATGGTPPFEYSLDSVSWQSSNIFTGLTPTNLPVVRDANGCIIAGSQIDLDVAPTPISLANTFALIPGGACTPRIDSFVFSGVGSSFEVVEIEALTFQGQCPISFDYADQLSKVEILSVGADYLVISNDIDLGIDACSFPVGGALRITIRDENECQLIFNHFIEPKFVIPVPEIVSRVGITCPGDTDGQVTAKVEESGPGFLDNRLPPFTFRLNNTSPITVTSAPYQVTYTGMVEGPFVITVTDSLGCLGFIVDTIPLLNEYDFTINRTDVTGCGTDSTGALSVTVNSGGSLPYGWTWYVDNNGGGPWTALGPAEILNATETTTISNRPVGQYKAIIIDGNSCVDTLTFGINGPASFSLLKVDSTNLSCNSSADGSITVRAIGGTTPRTFSIDGGVFGSATVFTGLAAGLHTIVASDANACTDTVEFTLTEPSAISIAVDTTNVSCNGFSDGTITITASGGVGTLMYALDGGTPQASNVFNMLAAGTYNVSVIDGSSCTRDSMNIPISEPSVLEGSGVIVDTLSCVQLATLTVTATGGTGAYTYSWDSGSSTNDTLYNVGPGAHDVTITDANNCTKVVTFNLMLPAPPVLQLDADTSEACGMTDGSFLVSASSGSSPYSFTSDGTTNTTGYFNGLSAGVYEVIATDDKGCMDTLSVTVAASAAPQITAIDSVRSTCAADDGSITLTLTGGTTPLTYTWSHDAGLNLPNATGLAPGIYHVTVTDARSCTDMRSISIGQTPSPVLTIVNAVNSSCGQNNGSALVNASGGQPGYAFSWSHSGAVTGPNASNLGPGNYEVIVTDQNSCKDTVNITIGENPPPIIAAIDSMDENCGMANGSITVTSTNGMRPYTYVWSHSGSVTDSVANNLSAGVYTVIVRDANMCRDTLMVTLDNMGGPTASLVDLRDNMCATGNGFIRYTSSGGQGPYVYTWSHDAGVTDSVAFDLQAGTYQVTVTDNIGCTDVISNNIVNTNLLTTVIDSVKPSGCDTATGAITLMTSGGLGTYGYTWSHDTNVDSNYVDSLAAGMYQVTVTDSLGCVVVLNVAVPTTPGPTIMQLSTTNSFCGPNMGAATMTATGGSRPYTYEWSHNASIVDSFATDLPSGGIIVRVRDANNCTSMTSFIVDETPAVVLSVANQVDETCELNNGSIVMSRTGGSGPFTYSWSHDAGIMGNIANTLSAGNYTIIITDNVGCADTVMTTIDSIPSPVISLVSSSDNSCEQENGNIVVSATSGIAPYSYTWSHDLGLTDSIATGLVGGTYTVIVDDMTSCSDTLMVTIADLPVLTVTEVEVTETSCTSPTGTATVGVTGGQYPYTYVWSHDATEMDSIATMLAVGNYQVIVSDVEGCSDTLSVTIVEANPPLVSLGNMQNATCGMSDGSITIDVTNGAAPFTYTWSHDAGLNDSIAPNLATATYFVTITDANSCLDTLSVFLPCDTPLTVVVADSTNELCDAMNGSITLDVTGGTSSYTYNWSHDGSLDTSYVGDLSAGTYTVTVTDNAAATVVVSVTLSNSPSPSLTIADATNNTCNAGNGSIALGVTSGTPPFTYMWSHDATLNDSIASNLGAGTYAVTITDDVGCSDTITQVIINDNLLVVDTLNVQNTGCSIASGSITLVTSGGIAPYTYAWSHDGSLTDSIATGLLVGTYETIVTDAVGCMDTIAVAIVETAPPIVSINNIQNESCGSSDGSITLDVVNGTGPYTYTWSHDAGLNDSIALNLASATYSVTITDANNCMDTLSVFLPCNPPLMVVVQDSMHETCSASNGSITLAVSGGFPPYTFLWSHDAAIDTSYVDGLSAGTYSVTVTDNMDSMKTISVTLSNSPSPILFIANAQNSTCNNGNGSITLGVALGSPPFTYTWSHDPGLTSPIAMNLGPGTYSATVTDNIGCFDTLSYIIFIENLLDVDTFSVQNTGCNVSTGSITLLTSGGIAPYSYTWSHDGSLTDSIATNLSVGTYLAVVTDNVGCMDTISAAIVETTPLVVSINTIQNETCGSSNGSITLDVSNGTGPYTYTWSHDAGLNDSIALNLATATYFVTVTDANNCMDTLSVFVPCDVALMVVVQDSINESCEANNGSITLGVSGGFAPYSYTWSHDASIDTSYAGGLAAGTYDVTVTDNMSDMQTISVTLTNLPSPVLSIASTENNNCSTGNGNITLSTSAGTAPFSYAWSHDATLTDSIATGLTAGTYSATITDDAGCVDVISQNIIDEDLLVVNVLEVNQTGCGTSTGSIRVEGSLGRPPYAYAWSHDGGLMDSIATNLGIGDYTVTVTDNGGCQMTSTATITNFGGPTLMLVDTSQSTCQLPNGSATISVTGGSPNYAYIWSHDVNETDSIASNLHAGTYSVTVTDANSCVSNLSFSLSTTPSVDLSVQNVIDATCGLDNGSITVSATGGTATYSYTWSHDNANNNTSAANLAAGSYQVIVTDQVGCMDTITQVISNTPPVTLTLINTENNACDQANGVVTVSASGGTGSITFAWQHDASLTDSTASGLMAGNYQVIATDSIGCSDTLTTTISDQATLMATEVSVTSSACNAPTGSITAGVTGGSGPYGYTWNHDASLMDSIATGLVAGNYQLIVNDVRGCVDTISFVVLQAESPSVSAGPIENATCGLSDGSITVHVSGGLHPYTYTWSHDAGLNDSIAINLPTSTYAVTVTDANGCFDTLSVFLPCDLGLMLTVTDSVNESCDASNGSITVEATGGTSPYMYTWSHDALLDTSYADGLTAGTYQVIASDANGSMDTISVTLTNITGVAASIILSTNNSCVQANGSIVVGASNGTAPYSFSWSHDATLTDSVATGLAAGAYTVIVSDGNDCADTITQNIIDAPFLSLSVVQVDSSACDPGTGSIEVMATGGDGGYTYSWSHDATLNANIATNLDAGSYTVTVADASTCVTELTIDVPEFIGPILAAVNVQNTTCGGATGSIELVPVGGLPPYTFIWLHDATLTGPLATGLAAGSYQYTVIDARNCEITDFATISSSNDLDINLVGVVRPSCDMNNGSLQIELTGGTMPYTIEWFNADDLTTVIGNTLVLNNLFEGTYIVEVSDVDGCTDQNIYTLIDVDDMVGLFNAVDETCADADDGLIAAAVASGGTAPFNFQWDDAAGSTTGIVNPVPAGTYHVTITDSRGCVLTDSVIVKQPEEISIDTFIITPACNDTASGSIFVTANGGVGDFTYLWPDDGASGATRTDLSAGLYNLVVVDSTGCQAVYAIEVPAAQNITLTAGDILPPACDGNTGGSLTVEVQGGQMPYVYSWNDALAQTTQTATDLLPGNYEVTVSDDGGCLAVLEMAVPDVAGLFIEAVDIIQPSCVGDADGEIEVQVFGGSGNYAYLWDDNTFQNTARATGLAARRYIVRVTDMDLGCVSRDTFFLLDPEAIVLDSFNKIDLTCFDGATGTASVFTSGGTGDYTYLWNDASNQVTQTAVGLMAGTYAVTVSDENMCAVSGEVMVDAPDELTASIIDSMGVSCFGMADGFIKVAGEGGTGPYTYFWPALSIAGDSVGGLEASLYTVEITDNNGCMSTAEVSISEPNELTVALVNLTNANCSGGQLGSITVVGQGGTSPYDYLWNDDAATAAATVNGLDGGRYTVTITDANLCTDTMSFLIEGAASLTIELIDSLLPLCNGDANGSLTVFASGGNDDYIFVWNDPAFQIGPMPVGLVSGAYEVTVTNGNGSCPTIATFQLNEPDVISLTPRAQFDVSCFGLSDGVLAVDVMGGTGDYTIDWVGIGTDLGDSLSMLPAGDLTIQVTDGNNCQISDVLSIDQPDELMVNPTVIHPMCFGDMTGSIVASPTGGTGTYQYDWSPPITDVDNDAENLSSGQYTLTVTDENLCTAVIDMTLTDQSPMIDMTVLDVMLPSCATADNGFVEVDASGGTGVLTYQWSNGSGMALNENLMASSYTVTITDGVGCSIDSTFDLSDAPDFMLDLAFLDTVACQGAAVAIGSDDIPGATYSWTGPDGFTSNEAIIYVSNPGDYTVQAVASSCTDSETVTVQDAGAVLQTLFVAPTQIVVGDTIVALEVTWPVPSGVVWSYDTDSVNLIGQFDNQYWFEFPFVGTYDLALTAELGACSSIISKRIEVFSDSTQINIPTDFGERQILSMTVAPNPSAGLFAVDFELNMDLPYDIRIYQVNGSSAETRQGSGIGNLSESFNFSSAANGTYIVTLQSGGEIKWKTLVIERP